MRYCKRSQSCSVLWYLFHHIFYELLRGAHTSGHGDQSSSGLLCGSHMSRSYTQLQSCPLAVHSSGLNPPKKWQTGEVVSLPLFWGFIFHSDGSNKKGSGSNVWGGGTCSGVFLLKWSPVYNTSSYRVMQQFAGTLGCYHTHALTQTRAHGTKESRKTDRAGKD